METTTDGAIAAKTCSGIATRRFDGEITLAGRRSDVVEVSAFGNMPPATDDEIDRELYTLRNVFTEQSPVFYGILKSLVKETGMSAQRLHFAVTQFLLTHTYAKSFTPAELLGIDRKIVMARSIQALRQKVKHTLEYEDIVMVEYCQERRFTLAEDAEKFGMNILARYTSPYGLAKWVGTYTSPLFEQRRHDFGVEVGKFQKYYPREMCVEFYRYWSQPVQCGDVMLKDIQWSSRRVEQDGTPSDLIEEQIDEWAVKHGYKSRYINKSEYEKSESESQC